MANEQVTKDFEDRAKDASDKARKAMDDYTKAMNQYNKAGPNNIDKKTEEDIADLKRAAAEARQREVVEQDRLRKWEDKQKG